MLFNRAKWNLAFRAALRVDGATPPYTPINQTDAPSGRAPTSYTPATPTAVAASLPPSLVSLSRVVSFSHKSPKHSRARAASAVGPTTTPLASAAAATSAAEHVDDDDVGSKGVEGSAHAALLAAMYVPIDSDVVAGKPTAFTTSVVTSTDPLARQHQVRSGGRGVVCVACEAAVA